LDLTLTNIAHSPSLERILSDKKGIIEQLPENAFPKLAYLSIDSSHLSHVHLGGRSKLLDILGRNLLKLSFRNLSPDGVFAILQSKCPKLVHLRMDKAHSQNDFEKYSSTHLLHLELCRCPFLLSNSLSIQFPSLKSLRFSPANRLDASQIMSLVERLPINLLELSMEIPSTLANVLVNAVSNALYSLKKLHICGSHETGFISRESLILLGNACRSLQSLQITCAYMVNPLLFNSPSDFTLLESSQLFPCLSSLHLTICDVVLSGLPGLLAHSTTLQNVTLLCRKNWIPQNIALERMCTELSMQYPHIKLELDMNFSMVG